MKKVIILIFLLCSLAFAEKPYRILHSFSSGELHLLNAREDLAKYHSGCSLMENMIPIPQGGAQKRPGTIYVAESKNNTVIRLLPFEYSTEQSYVLELGNQYMRFYTSNAQITTGAGTETLAPGNVTAHWLLNETDGLTVNEEGSTTHNGTSSVDCGTLTATGKVGTGCFDLDAQYTVEIADDANFSFTDDSNDTAFSIACWAYITPQSAVQNLLSKWRDDNVAREWRFSLNNSQKLQLHLSDTTASLTGDIVSHYKLNDDAADTLVDDDIELEDGNSTPSNTTDITTTGKIGKCFDFGGDQAVEIDDQATHSFGNGTDDSAFSLAAWIFVEDNGLFQYILSKFDLTSGSEAREWRFHLYIEQLVFFLQDENANRYQKITTNSQLTAGWHFVVGTYDGRGGSSAALGMNLYVDGSIASSWREYHSGYVAMENTATKVVIGSRYGTGGSLGSFFENKIDNVMIFDVELSAAEISSLWNDGSGTETLSSGGGDVFTASDDAISLGWHFLACTYSAPWSDAGDGIIFYVDGVAVDSTATNDDNYTAMQGAGEAVRIGSQNNSGDSADEKFWGDKIDEVSIFSDVLTPTEITALFAVTPYEITTPYLTADLFELKYEQSADVLYIAHPDYETRKLSRYADTDWTVTAFSANAGPFRTQNIDEADTISASATTGSVTLTATGHFPFALGSTAGHEPSGSIATSKSQTGALFRLAHPISTLSFSDTLEDDIGASQTEGVSWMSCGTLYEGAGWTWVTGGTWLGTAKVQRNYTIGAAVGNGADEGASLRWETVFSFDGVTTARNISTAGSEDDGDADYRIIFADDTSGTIESYFTTNQTEHIGVVQITSVSSLTSAIGTVLTTLASTDATHKWSEGSWSNYRGWPIAVAFFEDRLVFGGNTSQPDTIWGSVTADYENMKEGANDDDAVAFTLSSRQVNAIRWLVGKNKILIGTSGAEWSLSGSVDEPLTPSNVKAEQQSTYGSANLQANLVNESVLFFQRGAEKMRELAYNWELDSYVAPDMTILAKEITGNGITDTAFQQIPDSILWCVREDGELPIFSYERKENITSWSRLITDGDFESVAIIHGAAEDQVWVSVERTIDSNPVRYIEYFSARDFGDDPCDAFYVDCGATYTTDVNVISDLTWLEGESVIALADGAIVTDLTVSSDSVTLGGVYQQVQIGLPYTVQLRTMPLSWVGEGTTIQGRIKRINEVIPRWYKSGDFYIGRDSTDKELVSITGQTTSEDRVTFPPGYDRPAYVYVYQLSPEPLTILALMIEFMIY